MTEEEAKKKYCPFLSAATMIFIGIRISPESELPVEMQEKFKALPNCSGSGCMMWRWNIIGATVNGVYDDNYPVEGHCGLGGKP